MKKSIISLAVAAGLVASMPAAHAGDVKVKWFGFAQITAKQGDGLDLGNTGVGTDGNGSGAYTSGNATGPVFGADRVRFGFKIKDGNVFGKLQADLNKTDSGAKPGTLPQIIKDVEAGYKFSNAASVKAGQFKTPVGMDFNVSGKKLDITQRGMEKSLVMERAAGVMLSGRKIANGFGYDLFFGNVAGRGKAHAGGVAADDNSMAARVMYDMGKMMHVELGYGKDQNSTTGKEDYEVLDLGFRMKMAAMTIKFEYIDGTSVKGVKDADETVWYGHFGYNLNKTTELVVRHYQADQDRAGAGSQSYSLSNTYLGANFYLGSNKTNGRIQINYVISGGDNDVENGTNVYDGVAAGGKVDTVTGDITSGAGYYDDVILAQYQVSF